MKSIVDSTPTNLFANAPSDAGGRRVGDGKDQAVLGDRPALLSRFQLDLIRRSLSGQ